MSDLGDLYQQVILDHNRNPRNFKRVDLANRKAEGNNPLCGDRIQLYVQLDGDTITDIGFQMPQGSGCAISKASASLMTDAVKGKTAAAAETMFQQFRDMLRSEEHTSELQSRRDIVCRLLLEKKNLPQGGSRGPYR